MKTIPILTIAILTCLVTTAHAVILWDESVNGPFGTVYTSATPLGNLLAPTSELYGAASHTYLGNGNYVTSGDYFTFTVPAGYQVDSISATIARPNLWAWIGTPTFGSTLGFTSNATSGTLLSQLGISSPIPSGTYGMYLEHHQLDAATSSNSYALSLRVSSLPEPSTAALLSGAAVALSIRRRTRRPYQPSAI